MGTTTTASTITVTQTLGILDSSFAEFAKGVAENLYALWLGSGISRTRVDGVGELIPRVLEFLRSQITADPGCPFTTALKDALGLAPLTKDEWDRVDFTRPFDTWPDAYSITNRLINNYARLLNIRVGDKPDDYLLWEGIDMVATFADPAIKPDAEHLCIAILILEGVASHIASANWDGLIERAVDELTGGSTSLVVCVRPDELREPGNRAALYKFHGCAVKAAEDETKYRSHLIGRAPQISGWVENAEYAAMVDKLVSLATTRPTLMLGLSAQDSNIQAIFARAKTRMEWPWPGNRPSYVVSGNELGYDQRSLLENVYPTAYIPANRDAIAATSLIQAYAKPLLIALVLHVLCSKLANLIELAPGDLDGQGRLDLQRGVKTLRDALAASIEQDHHLDFVQAFIEHSGSAITMFRDGRASSTKERYNPLTPIPVHQLATDPTLASSGIREAAVAAGILGIGMSSGNWNLTPVDPSTPTTGAIRVTSAARSVKAFFVANSNAALYLQNAGYFDDADETVVVHSLHILPAATRSPRGAPGRIGNIGLQQVSIAELLEQAADTKQLIERFREEVLV